MKSHYITNGYFDLKHFPHNVECGVIVKIYHYNFYKVEFLRDISDRIIDYSYECDRTSNIRQTASITVKVDTDDETWYARRENKMYEWFDKELMSEHGLTWLPIVYQIIKTYSCKDDDTANKPKQIDLGFFYPTNNSYTYDSTTGTISISLQGLSCLLTKEYGGSVLAARTGVITRDPDTHELVEKVFPMTLGIAEGTSVDGEMFFNLIKGSYGTHGGWFNITAHVPLAGATIGNGQILYSTPYDIDYDADVGRSDIIDEIVNLTFEGANYWIDENRYFWVSSTPVKRGQLVAHWADYGELFIGESVTYDDSNFFNITEVYGKDNRYYAICDEADYDGSYASHTRKQILQFDELISNDECQARADWENYKARYGRMSISVQLIDRYIPQFANPSTKVGRTIEYTTVDGDTNLYFLNKLSYSGNVWTMDLTLFKPLYRETKERAEDTLSMPTIVKHEVINNNTLRLYVSSDDIKNAAVKIYVDRVSFPDFCGISANDDGDYKIVDIPISQNGKYYCYASLYSPYYEDSPISGIASMSAYEADVTEIVTMPITDDPDPYPHPNMFVPEGEHEPWLRTHNDTPLTTDDGENITI